MHKSLNFRSLGSQLKKIFAIAAFSVRQRLTSPHVIVVILIITVYIWDSYLPVKELVEMTGVKANPLIFPFLSSEMSRQLAMYAGVVFVFSDVPFLNKSQPYIMIRSKRVTWALGQILHVILFSGIYYLLIMTISLIIMLPDGTFATDGWGKIVNTFIETDAGFKVGLGFSFYETIATYYSPLWANVCCFLLNWLGMSFFGLLMFSLSLSTKPFVGPVAAGMLIFADMYVCFAFNARERHFSPLTLTRLGELDALHVTNYPSLQYALSFFAVGILVFSVIAIIAVRKKPVEVISEL